MSSSSVRRSGISNYARYLNVLSGTTQVFPVEGQFDLLETTTLSEAAASIEFTNLTSKYANVYQHIQFRTVTRSTRATALDFIGIRLNGDTGNNYTRHAILGTSSGVGRYGLTGTNLLSQTDGPSAGNTANEFMGSVIDILDAFETSKKKTLQIFNGSAGQTIGVASGLWNNTNSLNSVQFFSGNSANLAVATRVSLYGVK